MKDDPLQLGLIVATNSSDPSRPPELCNVNDDFFPLVGRIILNWGLLEQEANILIEAIARYTEIEISNSWKKFPFSKRWDILQTVWHDFVDENIELSSEMIAINSDMNKGKYIRDCLAHKHIAPGIDDRGPFLRFQNENKSFPWTKRFREADLASASLAIASANGRLFRITNLDYAQSFSPKSISILQKIPDTNYLRFPVPKSKRIQ